jgi:hypothetical protein
VSAHNETDKNDDEEIKIAICMRTSIIKVNNKSEKRNLNSFLYVALAKR